MTFRRKLKWRSKTKTLNFTQVREIVSVMKDYSEYFLISENIEDATYGIFTNHKVSGNDVMKKATFNINELPQIEILGKSIDNSHIGLNFQ